MQLALVGTPRIDLDALLIVTKETCGQALLAKLDERRLPASEMEKFLVALAGFQSGRSEAIVPGHLLQFVHLSWLALADGDELMLSLNWLPAAERLIVPTGRRNLVTAWIQTGLDDALEAVADMAKYNQPERDFFLAMHAQLDRHDLLSLWQNPLPRLPQLTQRG